MFIDSHIHLSRKQFDGTFPCTNMEKNEKNIVYMNREQLIDEMKAKGIMHCIEPGVELESNEQLLALGKKLPSFLHPTVGVHPTRAPKTKWRDRKKIEKLADDERVIAIGELGLDYHYERNKQHRLKQKMWFVWQLRLADKKGLPLILHIRMADKDAVKILRKYKKRIHGGVCHCFTGDYQIAKKYTEEFGLLLGIGGSLLQDHCEGLEDAVKRVPLEYLVLETDGPYVNPKKPEQFSGKQWKKVRNTSLIIPEVAARVAKLKGISVEEVEQTTTENVCRVLLKDIKSKENFIPQV